MDAEHVAFYALTEIDSHLKANMKKCLTIFRDIDDSGDGVLTVEEFQEGLAKLGLPFTRKECIGIFSVLDDDKSGTLNYKEIFTQGKRKRRKLSALLSEADREAARAELSAELSGRREKAKLDALLKKQKKSVKKKVLPKKAIKVPSRDSFTVFVAGRLRGYLSKNFTKALCVFRDLDDNGDGTLSCAEFRKGILEIGIPLSLDEVKSLLKDFDADGDGSISFREFCDGIRDRHEPIALSDRTRHAQELDARLKDSKFMAHQRKLALKRLKKKKLPPRKPGMPTLKDLQVESPETKKTKLVNVGLMGRLSARMALVPMDSFDLSDIVGKDRTTMDTLRRVLVREGFLKGFSNMLRECKQSKLTISLCEELSYMLDQIITCTVELVERIEGTEFSFRNQNYMLQMGLDSKFLGGFRSKLVRAVCRCAAAQGRSGIYDIFNCSQHRIEEMERRLVHEFADKGCSGFESTELSRLLWHSQAQYLMLEKVGAKWAQGEKTKKKKNSVALYETDDADEKRRDALARRARNRGGIDRTDRSQNDCSEDVDRSVPTPGTAFKNMLISIQTNDRVEKEEERTRDEDDDDREGHIEHFPLPESESDDDGSVEYSDSDESDDGFLSA